MLWQNKNMKKIILIPLSLIFVGCAGLQTSLEYDRNAERRIIVNFEGKDFAVQDDLAKSAALVTEDVATDVVKGFLEGLTFTLVDFTASVGKFEGAMNNYLDTYKKDSDCEITRSNFISDGAGGGVGYEIFYKCE
jgi:hypothetical protein